MKLLSPLAFLATFSCAAQPTFAQQMTNCAPVEVIEQTLLEGYAEQPTWTGLSNDGLLVHLWTNEETGTWTYLYEGPDKNACIIKYGDVFEIIPPQPEEELN